MKLDNVTQWVRSGGTLQVPSVQSLASRTVVNLTCINSNVGCGAEGIKNTGCVTEPRNLYGPGPLGYPSPRRESRRHPAVRKAEVSKAVRQAFATPAGSAIASRACIHRGNSGTREVQYSPSRQGRKKGGPVEQSSKAWIVAIAPSVRESGRKHELSAIQGYLCPSESVGPRDGILEVLAEHSTEPEAGRW